VTLEDLTGQVECLFFPRVWEQYAHLVREDLAVLLSGRLSIQEDKPISLIVNTAQPLTPGANTAQPDQAPDEALLAKDAPIKLYLNIDRAQIPACEALLKRSPGDVPVFLHLKAERQTLLAPREWWVMDALDARADLLTILHNNQVKVVDKTR
jgi:DNA polymerase-3 subunit alpha